MKDTCMIQIDSYYCYKAWCVFNQIFAINIPSMDLTHKVVGEGKTLLDVVQCSMHIMSNSLNDMHNSKNNCSDNLKLDECGSIKCTKELRKVKHYKTEFM